MKGCVIIPARNEGERLWQVLEQTKSYCDTIIVVDDGSSDHTIAEAQRAGVTVLRHRVNLGKGAALKTGCDYAILHGAEQIVVMDADGQHDPKEIPLFLQALEQSDIAFGSRQVPETMPLILKFGNTFMSTMLKMLYGMNITDSQCGYRSFTAGAYKKIRWDATNYYVESEMIINAGRKKLRHTQIPIETIYSDNYKGTTVWDGVIITAKMIGWRFLK